MSKFKLVCPCGGTEFLEKSHVSGWWQCTLGGHGHPIDTNLDLLTIRPPKTVRCEDCGRRHPNPSVELL